MPRLTLQQLQAMKQEQKKITVLTLYDASFAHIASEAGVDIVFVGDSLGMVIKGKNNTIPVSNEEIIYHTKCVVAGNSNSVVMSDLAYLSYYTPEIAIENTKPLLQAGAEIIKIEGGEWLADTIHFLTERGVAVCAHIGLTPQFIHILGGFKVQGRNEKQAQELLKAAIALEQAGAQMLLLECVPHLLAKEITASVNIPTIGIGAGPVCDGQVLVVYDILGLTPGKTKKFVKNFMEGNIRGIKGAIEDYVAAVRNGEFPTLENSFE